MATDNTKQGDTGELRRQAEERLAADTPQSPAVLSPAESSRLLHELRVRQVELKLQNDELRRLQVEVESFRARYFDLYDLSPVGYCTVDANGLILEGNMTLLVMLGKARGDLVRTPFSGLIASEYQDIWRLQRKKILETLAPQSFDLRLRRKDGTFFWARCDAKSATEKTDGQQVTRVAISDVTGNKILDEQVGRLQRLESLGTLAGGIAHDFNNTLTGIFGYLELIRQQDQVNPTILKYVSSAIAAFDRTRDLTRQLLTFAKGGAPVTSAVDINQLIRESAGFVLTASPVVADFHLQGDLTPVEADPHQIRQAIDALLSNALQAMPNGGTITITTQMTTDGFIRISIVDHGCGISPEILPKVFDPFFTTKEAGRGLGLTIAHSIVTRHGGSIEVTSQLGQETSFLILLPAHTAIVATIAKRPEIPKPKGQRVLVMDDEPSICELVETMLGMIGCQNETVSHGKGAIAAYSQAMEDGHPFDLVIMDLTIPGGMGGVETLAALRKIDPTVRAIVSSGYADSPVMANPQKFGFLSSLPKPYPFSAFQDVVRKALA